MNTNDKATDFKVHHNAKLSPSKPTGFLRWHGRSKAVIMARKFRALRHSLGGDGGCGVEGNYLLIKPLRSWLMALHSRNSTKKFGAIFGCMPPYVYGATMVIWFDAMKRANSVGRE